MNISFTKVTFIGCLVFGILTNTFAQDRNQAEIVIDILCSDSFAGRGYLQKGDEIAANFIRTEFKKVGLKSATKDYFQQFYLNVNTIPKSQFSIDGKQFKAGYDYLVSPSSNSGKGKFKVFYVSNKLLLDPSIDKKIKKAIRKGFVPVIPQYDSKNKNIVENIAAIKECNNGKVIVFLKDHLTWSVARNQQDVCEIWLLDSVFDRFSNTISLDVKSEFIENYKSQNVIGYVPGTENPDSFIMFCGHYDHLGKMGDAIFYGANDNASGISILLDMAKFFVSNPQKYSIVFVAFGGEEAGLVGSYNYVSNPPLSIPLNKTKFVFNMDLMGSGESGATIVNGSLFIKEFDELVEINNANNYLPKINKRGKAANSDHYFFSEAGIPAFFIYLMGEYKHYHIPADNAKNLKLGEYYDRSFLLIRDFIIYLNK